MTQKIYTVAQLWDINSELVLDDRKIARKSCNNTGCLIFQLFSVEFIIDVTGHIAIKLARICIFPYKLYTNSIMYALSVCMAAITPEKYSCGSQSTIYVYISVSLYCCD